MAETRKPEQWVPIHGNAPQKSLYSLKYNIDTNVSRDSCKDPLVYRQVDNYLVGLCVHVCVCVYVYMINSLFK